MTNQLSTQILNIGGTQSGVISNSVYNGGIETGNLLYTELFDNTVTSTQSYFNTIENFVKEFINISNWGVYTQVSSEKKFTTGSFNSLDTPVTNVSILGKLVNYQKYLSDVANELINEIENGTDFLTTQLVLANVTQSDIRAVKNNFKQQINDQLNKISSQIAGKLQQVSNTQAQILQIYRKMDLICSATDGKINSAGSPYVYTITGLPDGTSDTLTSIRTDYIKIASDIQSFYNLLNSEGIIIDVITPSTSFTPISNVTFNSSVNKFYTLFSNVVIDSTERETLINSLTQFLFSSSVNVTKSTVAQTINGLEKDFKDEKNAETQKVTNFFSSENYLIYQNYNPQVSNQSIKGKQRNFTYTTAGATSGQQTNLKDLYSSVNVNLDKTTYNGKIIFD